jgi:hypothetical protein
VPALCCIQAPSSTRSLVRLFCKVVQSADCLRHLRNLRLFKLCCNCHSWTLSRFLCRSLSWMFPFLCHQDRRCYGIDAWFSIDHLPCSRRNIYLSNCYVPPIQQQQQQLLLAYETCIALEAVCLCDSPP